MTSASKLGLKVVIDGVEKDLDEIFLTFEEFNNSDRLLEDKFQLNDDIGIKYYNGSYVDINNRYVAYNSAGTGYVSSEFDGERERITDPIFEKIKDKNGRLLTDLFYQKNCKKKVSENLINIENGEYYIRVTNNSSNSNYKFQFNFPIGTIIWMEILNNIVYLKNSDKTEEYLKVKFDTYNINTKFIQLNTDNTTLLGSLNTFLRNNDTLTYYLSLSNSEKHQAKCIIIN